MAKRKALILSAASLFLILALILAVTGSRKNTAYDEALRLTEIGDTVRAYTLFKELGGYKDAEEKAAELVLADPALPYRALSKGDTVTFGSYEQDNDFSDGNEPIEWIVLDRIDDEILLLSASCLDCRTYNDIPFESVTWEESAIRKWLNEDFYSQAFSDEERQLIMLTENVNPDQSVVGTNGGADTEDRVFLLCEKEARIYIGDEMNRDYIGAASATEYAVSHGAHTDETGMCEWWLRTPGTYEYAAQFIETDGNLYTAGAYVDIAYAVRPFG